MAKIHNAKKAHRRRWVLDKITLAHNLAKNQNQKQKSLKKDSCFYGWSKQTNNKSVAQHFPVKGCNPVLVQRLGRDFQGR